jgi:hypothetical protein
MALVLAILFFTSLVFQSVPLDAESALRLAAKGCLDSRSRQCDISTQAPPPRPAVE